MTSNYWCRLVGLSAVLIAVGVVVDTAHAQQRPMCQNPIPGCVASICTPFNGSCVLGNPPPDYTSLKRTPTKFSPCGPGPTMNCKNILRLACTMTAYTGDMANPCDMEVCQISALIAGC